MSVPEEQVEQARRADDDDVVDMLAELDAQEGPPTAEDFAWAERVLGL